MENYLWQYKKTTVGKNQLANKAINKTDASDFFGIANNLR